MQRTLLFSLILFILSACSTPIGKREEKDNSCLKEDEIQKTLKSLEKVVDESNSNTTQASVLSEAKCNKRVYRRGDYRLLVYRENNGVAGKAQTNREFQPETIRKCFEEALQEIEALQIEGASLIFQLYRKKFGDKWNDLDLGPAGWLKCRTPKDSDYYDSLGTMIHETGHDVRNDHCLLVARKSETLCFTGADALPLRGIAKIEKFSTSSAPMNHYLEQFQNVYLTQTNQPYPLLLEELNEYTVSARATSRMVEKLGEKAVGDAHSRSVVLLPVLMVWTLNYLERTRAKDPSLFEKHFGIGSGNRKNIFTFLTEAETEFKKWQKTLVKFHLKKIEIEELFWKAYWKKKGALFGK